MSELKGAKMEGSKVPAEEIKNPDLVAATIFHFPLSI